MAIRPNPPPPPSRRWGRNSDWGHLFNRDVDFHA